MRTGTSERKASAGEGAPPSHIEISSVARIMHGGLEALVPLRVEVPRYGVRTLPLAVEVHDREVPAAHRRAGSPAPEPHLREAHACFREREAAAESPRALVAELHPPPHEDLPSPPPRTGGHEELEEAGRLAGVHLPGRTPLRP